MEEFACQAEDVNMVNMLALNFKAAFCFASSHDDVLSTTKLHK